MEHVRDSFARQKAMSLIGASLSAVDKGESEIRLPYRAELTQQKGFVHGGIIGMIADSAAGYAAYSLMPAGRTLTVARAEVYAEDGTHVASMQQTLMMLPNTPDTPE
jgi:acyl-coenzyme A thioesterase PaaI-like protein